MPLYTVDDITLEVPQARIGTSVRKALETGRFEHGEARALRRHFTAKDRLLELGCGTGFLSSIAGRIAGGTAITAVEAFPDMVEVARANLARNDVQGATLHWGAAVPDGFDAPHVEFATRQEFWSSRIGLSRRGRSGGVQVPALKLGTLLRDSRATILCCDIEGGELDLFAAELPADLRLIIMEIHPNHYGNIGTKQVFDALSCNGFAYYPYGSMGAVVVFERI